LIVRRAFSAQRAHTRRAAAKPSNVRPSEPLTPLGPRFWHLLSTPLLERRLTIHRIFASLSRAACIRTAHVECLRDSLRLRRSLAFGSGRRPPWTPSSTLDSVHSGSQGGGEDGRSARFLLFEPRCAARKLRSLLFSPCDSNPQFSASRTSRPPLLPLKSGPHHRVGVWRGPEGRSDAGEMR